MIVKSFEFQVKIFLNSVPVAKVMVIEGGNSIEGKDSQLKETNERPIHPYEAQEVGLRSSFFRVIVSRIYTNSIQLFAGENFSS